MAALKGLIDSECGQTNPLIKLSQFYARDNTLVTQDGLIKQNNNTFGSSNIGDATIDDLVSEYYLNQAQSTSGNHQLPLAAPGTFHFEGLLSGLRLSDDTNTAEDRFMHPTKHNSAMYDWTTQFLDTLPDIQTIPLTKTTTISPPPQSSSVTNSSSFINNNNSAVIHPPHSSYSSMQLPQSSSFSSSTQQQSSHILHPDDNRTFDSQAILPDSSSMPFSSIQEQRQSSFLLPNNIDLMQQQQEQWMSQPYWNEQTRYIRPLSTSYLNNTSFIHPEQLQQENSLLSTNKIETFDNDTAKTARNILSLLHQETPFSDTEFKSFVEQLANETNISNSMDKTTIRKPSISNTSQNEQQQQQQQQQLQPAQEEKQDSIVQDWIDEFTKEANDQEPKQDEKVWNNTSTEASWQNEWADSTLSADVDPYSEYKFSKNNLFMECPDPYEEGLKRLREQDIVNAVMLFEAAVQKNPQHVDAWLYLGITQSENEQDGPAICALKKCIEIDPKNLQAYLTLGSCYANELMTNEALDSLRKWLSNNEKYSYLLETQSATNDSAKRSMDIVDESAFEELQELFLQAVSAPYFSHEIDSDLQVCLGILFHLPGDYDKAAECFNTAVHAKPDDALLWNKLGAALANGGQSEKAVEAYYHALNLSPGFVRARYNLGISCFNLSAYKQAIEHFITALKQQSEGIGPQGQIAQMSDNIWRTLAIALDHMNRTDLDDCIQTKNLQKLIKIFDIE
ncbi:unnamed protein product [Didymodactylos carnosus]|uniref:Peroxin-5 n=1 Tax=Didymodactylos carnosus TaxID=1234261 RepID=A0A813NQ63_9BILA|nr:unnamed protein product [Didymodactylos carnosus]CAF3520499.1 unnamed protein product [Didymodactylos carnosus]